MLWTLILFAHASMMSDHDSMALTNIQGFKSQQECVAAGNQAAKMAQNTFKVIKFSCVQVEK